MLRNPEQDGDLVAELREMSVRQLVRWLSIPAKSGFYLSADDIRRLGATLNIRVTPFGRANGLEQFLRSAALDDLLPQALELLEAEMRAHLDAYRRLGLPQVDAWHKRGSATVEAWSSVSATFAMEEPS